MPPMAHIHLKWYICAFPGTNSPFMAQNLLYTRHICLSRHKFAFDSRHSPFMEHIHLLRDIIASYGTNSSFTAHICLSDKQIIFHGSDPFSLANILPFLRIYLPPATYICLFSFLVKHSPLTGIYSPFMTTICLSWNTLTLKWH